MATVHASQHPQIVQQVVDGLYTFLLVVDDQEIARREVSTADIEADAGWLAEVRAEMAKHNEELWRSPWDRTHELLRPNRDAELAFMRAIAIAFPDVDVPEAQL